MANLSSNNYILAIDQSTSGTKAMLFNQNGEMIQRCDLPHKQYINEIGWVEHDPEEIFQNVISVVELAVDKSGIDKNCIKGIGISNQRETAVVWDRETGAPVYNAIVWQCARGENICNRIQAREGQSDKIKKTTGLHLSPYFTASKIAWVLENVDECKKNSLCAGTIDSWLLFKLAGVFRTDYSNASRTQLLDLETLCWSEEVCSIFGIDVSLLPEICDSNACFGYTDINGYLDNPIPIYGVLGDSNGALFGQGCHRKGMMKATYGTGSSIMMNIGEKPIINSSGIVTSIAWSLDGKVEYVLEGNINYTGAVTKWIVDDLGLIESPKLSSQYAKEANPDDQTYLVPAFSGLGAPYWDSEARAVLCGMSRTTGKAEIVKAASECIAYQIFDIVKEMCEASNIPAKSLYVDGGATKDIYLMQFQSDILGLPVLVSQFEELSGIGAAYMAGIALGLFEQSELFSRNERKQFSPTMEEDKLLKKISGWKSAVQMVLKNHLSS